MTSGLSIKAILLENNSRFVNLYILGVEGNISIPLSSIIAVVGYWVTFVTFSYFITFDSYVPDDNGRYTSLL